MTSHTSACYGLPEHITRRIFMSSILNWPISKCFRFPFYLTTQEQSADLDSLNNLLHSRLFMPFLICLFFDPRVQLLFMWNLPGHRWSLSTFPTTLLIPVAKFLHKIQIVLYYLLKRILMEFEIWRTSFHLKHFGKFGGNQITFLLL